MRPGRAERQHRGVHHRPHRPARRRPPPRGRSSAPALQGPARAEAGPRGVVDGWLRALSRLLVPTECPGCGCPDTSLCGACAGLLAGPPSRREADAPRLDRMDGAGPLPVWALAPYAGPLRGVVVAWKDKGRQDLSRVLDGAAHRAASTLAPWVRATLAVASARGQDGPRRLLVVPAPSSAGARRARGTEPVQGLAQAVARALRDAGLDARAAPVLAQRGRDQVGLGARLRGARLGGVRTSRRAIRAGLLGPGSACLLVDDVLTTGATLAACERALAGSGAWVLAALVLAATPPPRGEG